VDYVIEFARGIDNLVGYFPELDRLFPVPTTQLPPRLDYYFDIFLQNVKKAKTSEYIKEIERYNQCMAEYGNLCDDMFFAEVDRRHPEFKALFVKYKENKSPAPLDFIQYILENSPFVNKEENKWMKIIIEVIRKTSLFFQPQIRTKIMNEGWASYWHEILFLRDDRIEGHEVDFARVNAGVTAMPRVGLNPYALGMRLFYAIEEWADKGRLTWDFQRLRDTYQRDKYDRSPGRGREYIFHIRENLCDFTFINQFINQDFVTRHNLFVAGRRLNESKMVWEYYVKSRNSDDYRQMLLDALYHPPRISLDHEKGKRDNTLFLVHRFENKPLIKDFITNTLMGIEYLWGGPVELETHEPLPRTARSDRPKSAAAKGAEPPIQWQRVVYTMKERKLSRRIAA
jgi:stage V sporulation protein R